MSNIKSDNQGFLIGEPLDINGTFALWTEIRDDMKAIRKALAGGERVSSVRNLSPTMMSGKNNLPSRILPHPEEVKVVVMQGYHHPLH